MLILLVQVHQEADTKLELTVQKGFTGEAPGRELEKARRAIRPQVKKKVGQVSQTALQFQEDSV